MGIARTSTHTHSHIEPILIRADTHTPRAHWTARLRPSANRRSLNAQVVELTEQQSAKEKEKRLERLKLALSYVLGRIKSAEALKHWSTRTKSAR